MIAAPANMMREADAASVPTFSTFIQSLKYISSRY